MIRTLACWNQNLRSSFLSINFVGVWYIFGTRAGTDNHYCQKGKGSWTFIKKYIAFVLILSKVLFPRVGKVNRLKIQCRNGLAIRKSVEVAQYYKKSEFGNLIGRKNFFGRCPK